MSPGIPFLCKTLRRFFFCWSLSFNELQWTRCPGTEASETKIISSHFWDSTDGVTMPSVVESAVFFDGPILPEKRISSAVVIRKFPVSSFTARCHVTWLVVSVRLRRLLGCRSESRSFCCRWCKIQYFSRFYRLLISIRIIFNGILCSLQWHHHLLKHIFRRLARRRQRQIGVHTFR